MKTLSTIPGIFTDGERVVLYHRVARPSEELKTLARSYTVIVRSEWPPTIFKMAVLLVQTALVEWDVSVKNTSLTRFEGAAQMPGGLLVHLALQVAEEILDTATPPTT